MDKLINVFSDDKSDYFTVFNQENHVIGFYENEDLLYEMEVVKENEGLFSLIFDGDSYIYTEKGNWLVEKRIGEEQSDFFSINGYKNIRLLKYLANKKILVRAANKETEDKLLIFDVIKKEIMFKLPLDLKVSLFEFKDMYLDLDNNFITLLCFYRQNVSRYADDLDFKDISLLTFFVTKDGALAVNDSLSVISIYDDFCDQSVSETRTDFTMKYPLFDYYSYYWPTEQSLTVSGKCVVYYSKEIGGLIISDVSDGDVRKLIRLPDVFKEEDFYYFNDKTGKLSIINENDTVHRYSIDTSIYASGDEIALLNSYYNAAYEKKINLQRNDPGGKFKSVLFDAIDATVLKEEKVKKNDNIR